MKSQKRVGRVVLVQLKKMRPPVHGVGKRMGKVSSKGVRGKT
jgi:hypothetical protein